MWSIEKQWVQIFERQQWVINQAKQQAFLFDQDLSSKLLLAGIPPNPCLALLNHQELISEVPFPRTRRAIPFSGTDCFGFDNPVAAAHYRQLANGLCAQHSGVNNGFDVGDSLPQCPISNGGCTSNGVPQHLQQEDPSVTSSARDSAAYHDSALQLARVAGEGHNGDAGRASIAVLQDQREENSGGISPEGHCDAEMVCLPKISNGGCASNGVTEDPTVASPKDMRDARVSDVYHDSALTPVRGTGEGLSNLPLCHISDAGCAFDGVMQDQKEENPSVMSPEDQRDARMSDGCLDPALSLARLQRSKSRQKALAIRNSTQKSGSQGKDNVDGYAGGTIKCLMSTPQSETVNELNDDQSVVGKPKIGECQSKERGSHIYSGRITRSRSSSHQENSLNVSSSPCICKTSGGIAVDSIGKSTQLFNHVFHSVEKASYSHITNDSCREGELKSRDYLSKEKQTVEEDSMSADLERDENTPKALQDVIGPSISKGDAGNSIDCRSPVEETHPNKDQHIVETSGSSPEGMRKEGGMGFEGVDSSPNCLLTSLHEEKEPSYSSLIKQAAGHPHDSLLEETEVALPTSVDIDGGSHCLKEIPVSLLQDNLKIENTEGLSCAKKTVQANRFDFGGPSRFSNLSGSAPHVKASQPENVDELNDNDPKVVKQKTGEFQTKEEGSNMFSGRITRSRSSGHQNSLIACVSPCIDRKSSGMAVNIDTMEQSCLKGLSTPASRKEIHGSSSVKTPLSFMHAEKKLEEGTTITAHGNYNSPLEMNFLGNCEVSAEVQSSSVEAVEEDFSDSRRLSNVNVISSVKGPDDAYTDADADTLLECRKTLKQKCSLTDDQTPLRVGRDCLAHRPVKEVSGSNAAKSTELVSEERAVDFNVLCNPPKSTDGDYATVSGPGSHRFLDAENLEVENPYAASRDELRSNLVQSTVNAYISPDYLQRSVSDDREEGAEPTECQDAENSKGRSISYSMDGSSPKQKRRKIDDKRVHDLSTSVTLEEEAFHAVKKDSMCANLEREEHSPTALQQVQGLSISQEDAGEITVGRSPAEERHLNEDHMVERSESLPQAQKNEGGTGLEGVDSSPNVPFTFSHEENEASVFSRLIMQSSEHPHDFLLEETGVTLPTNINNDGGSHCLKEDPLCCHIQDDIRLENAEDVSCAGRTILAKRFDFGGISNFTELSVSSPYDKSLDLTSADDAMPVLERFVIKTDDDPHSIDEDGSNFDEWNLPNNAVERASILEQLCRSACMQTPEAYSSTSYKLPRVEHLHQSVPTGVLEHVDLGTIFPISDNVKQSKDSNGCCTDPAFYGRSYSDCLPNFSGQSGWDIKKPYSSPVGTVWDRIASSSSSSGKRVSSIPELASINEEIENADEVADTFQGGIVSEVLDYSPQRLPLADITGIPNLPASVSKAVPYTDRLSIDSVTTEFRLTGTHKSVKKKPGIQNSTKRRYNNKENQSVSRGTQDIKRATGSLQNRYIKPELSEKTILRKGRPSLSELEPKPNNIVTNITSFIPLVQQKQAAAALPGKRDIKVKALEAAEAAKRLAERKDYERKMKKEAMKVERARVEQENVRKLELQKKRKEEERKKNEVDMAAKKRQREEEDKKEKQRKRIRVEEGRREQREHEEKSRVEKVKRELKSHASDGRGRKNENSKCNTVHKKVDEEMEHDTLRSISETDPRSSCVSANNARTGNAVHEEYCNFEHKKEGNLDKATENEKLVVNTSREQSYDISPYKESDDEDEEDDDSIPNNKFIPSWASKNCLALVASRQSVPAPEMIFHPKSFPCISEVLLPGKYQIQ